MARFVNAQNISSPIKIELDEAGAPKLFVSTIDPFNLRRNFENQCRTCGQLQIFLPDHLAQIEAIGIWLY